jgi:iron complex outermembrane recepter protein
VIRTINAGKVKVYGFDFDINYRPRSVPGLSLHGAVNYNIAKFITFPNAACTGGQTIAEGCNSGLPNPANGRFAAQDLSGVTLPRAPKVQMTLGFDYETDVGGDMTLSFGLDGQYSSKYRAALGNRQDFFQKSFAKLNANIALQGPDRGWELSLVGNNLFGTLRAGFCTPSNLAGGQILAGAITGAAAKGASGSDEVSCNTPEGREVWIRLTIRPGRLFGGS